jgi:hypothetical protein
MPAISPTPCFYFSSCRRNADLEKNGKSLCRSCAGRLKGREYPLRPPARQPLYEDAREAAEALDMISPRRRKLSARARLRRALLARV